jgi:hypothetical protein
VHPHATTVGDLGAVHRTRSADLATHPTPRTVVGHGQGALREPKVGGRPMRSPLGDECHQSYICARLFCIQPMADSRARVPVLEKYPAPSSVCPFIVLMITYSFGYKFTVCCSSAMAPTRPASDHLTRGKDHQHNITLFQTRPSYARIIINTKRSSVQPDRVQEGSKLIV